VPTPAGRCGMGAHVMELVVRGPLWPSLLAALRDFSVELDADGRTVIVGQVVDQSQLLGLLGLFHSVNVEVISVNRTAGITSVDVPSTDAGESAD
jgi:hypothetical protein